MAAIIQIPAADGYLLHGNLWSHPQSLQSRPVIIINCATSVPSRYYQPFAEALYAHDFTVLTYDYRGIGQSRYGSLRLLSAGWLDWGQLDFEAVLKYVHSHFSGRPIYVVGHSVGGFVIGLAPSSHLISRIFTMGAQYAFWRDYDPQSRMKMFLQWHIAMPFIARAMGFVPARRLGWMEDTPKGVALDWSGMGPRFEHCLGRDSPKTAVPADELLRRFQQVTATILALGVDDDAFGTPTALNRLLNYYTGSERHHLRISPASVQQTAIGHFAFFNKRFRDSLWPIAIDWLLAPDTTTAVPRGSITQLSSGNT